MAHRKTIGNRFLPHRFLLFFLTLFIAWPVGVALLGLEPGLLTGFDVAAALFLLSCIPLFRKSETDLRRAAAENDANRLLLLVISTAVTVVILAASTVLIVDSQQLDLADKLLIAATLVIVWFFANAVYTLHYAHLYYLADQQGESGGGLSFPGDRHPDMSDFAYFAFTIGVAVQTADVQIESRSIRRVVTVHAIVGFFFNLGVLALTINVLGSS